MSVNVRIEDLDCKPLDSPTIKSLKALRKRRQDGSVSPQTRSVSPKSRSVSPKSGCLSPKTRSVSPGHSSRLSWSPSIIPSPGIDIGIDIPQHILSPDVPPPAEGLVRYLVVSPIGVRCRTEKAPAFDTGYALATKGRLLVRNEFFDAKPAKDGWVMVGAGEWLPLWHNGRANVIPLQPEPSLGMHVLNWVWRIGKYGFGLLFFYLVLGVVLELQLFCESTDDWVPRNATGHNLTNESTPMPTGGISSCGLGSGIPESGKDSGNAPLFATIGIAVLILLHGVVTFAVRSGEGNEVGIVYALLPLLWILFILDLVYLAVFELGKGIITLLTLCCKSEEDEDNLEAVMTLEEVAPLIADSTRAVLAVGTLVGPKRQSIGLGYCMGYEPEDIKLLAATSMRQAICGIVRKHPELFPTEDEGDEEGTPGKNASPKEVKQQAEMEEFSEMQSPTEPVTPEPGVEEEVEEDNVCSCWGKCFSCMGNIPRLSTVMCVGMPCLGYIMVHYALLHCMVFSRYEFFSVMGWSYLAPYTGEAVLLYQRARGIIIEHIEGGGDVVDAQNTFLIEWVIAAFTGNLVMTIFFLCIARPDIQWLMGAAKKFLRKYTDRFEAGENKKVCGTVCCGDNMANLCRLALMPSLLGTVLSPKIIFMLSFLPAVSQWLEKLIWASLDKERSLGDRILTIIWCAFLSGLFDLIDDLPNNLALFWAAFQVVEDNYPGADKVQFFSQGRGSCGDFLAKSAIYMQWFVGLVMCYFLIKPGLLVVLTACSWHLPREELDAVVEPFAQGHVFQSEVATEKKEATEIGTEIPRENVLTPDNTPRRSRSPGVPSPKSGVLSPPHSPKNSNPVSPKPLM